MWAREHQKRAWFCSASTLQVLSILYSSVRGVVLFDLYPFIPILAYKRKCVFHPAAMRLFVSHPAEAGRMIWNSNSMRPGLGLSRSIVARLRSGTGSSRRQSLSSQVRTSLVGVK